mmetsp:Transcript_20894/g.53148  ORF Transcript_20894/g.53148 Transcript_20894/m.53148 type:complete len:460 (-) Transcript_20894:502-1881(-)
MHPQYKYMVGHLMVLVAILLGLAGTSYAQESIFGGLWSASVSWNVPDLVRKDQPYMMRAASAIQVPGAMSYDHVYMVDARNNTLQAYNWREDGAFNWTSEFISDLNLTLPILTVEPSMAASVPDVVYFLNTADGRLRAYSALAGKAPLWVSNFVCSTRQGMQYQWLGVNSAAGVVVARCNTGLAVIDSATGRRRFTISGRTVPPTQQVPFLSASALLTWRNSSVVAYSVKRPGTMPWSYAFPPGSQVTSVSPASTGLVAVTLNGTAADTLTLLSASGKKLSQITIPVNASAGLLNTTILPTPAIHKGVLYGIAAVLRADPSGIGDPAKLWFAFAVNVSDPRKPAIVWQNEPETGAPLPQQIQLSKFAMFVSIHGRTFVWKAFEREAGEFAWANLSPASRFGPSFMNPSIVRPTYCCETVLASAQIDSVRRPNFTVWAQYSLTQSMIPMPSLEEGCYCDE